MDYKMYHFIIKKYEKKDPSKSLKKRVLEDYKMYHFIQD